MIDRYRTQEIEQIWSEDNKFRLWHQIEIAFCEAKEPPSPLKVEQEKLQKIKSSKAPTAEQVKQREEIYHHETIAFLTAWKEENNLKEAGDEIHYGLTSSDLLDTATNLQIIQSIEIIQESLDKLLEIIKKQALTYKNTLTIGRTHGVHAEPTTFGLKLANWYDELQRTKEVLLQAKKQNSVAMFSGPVGTYTNTTPEYEKKTAKILGLTPVSISTQVISRERISFFIYSLAQLGSLLDKYTTELRHLQRTEVLEVEEPFYSGQRGSSAMPHKKNPWKSENISGLARLLRSYIIPALENIVLWHERDMSHSSVERVILPDACNLAHFMLERFIKIIDGLTVHEQNMLKNLNKFGGIVHSQKVMLSLVNAGMNKEDAYNLIQKIAHNVWNTETGNFRENLEKSSEVQKYLSSEEVRDIFEDNLVKKEIIDEIFERVFLYVDF